MLFVKILMIASQPFMEDCEIPLAIYNHIKALTLMGFEIDLITYHTGENVALPGLRVFRAQRLPFIHQVKARPSFARSLLDLLVFWLAFWRLCHNRYDYLHTHEKAGLMGIILSAIFGKRHLYYTYSSLSQQMGSSRFILTIWLTRLAYAIQVLIARYSDSIITIRPDVKGRIQEISPYTPIYLIENCTTDEQYSWSIFLRKSLQLQKDFTGEEIRLEQNHSLNGAEKVGRITNIHIEKVEETTCVV